MICGGRKEIGPDNVASVPFGWDADKHLAGFPGFLAGIFRTR